MAYHYSSNRNVQLLVAQFKARNIKKIIASPGTTNIELITSLQSDPFFEMYSCVDERSAAYMACGLSEESQEPVVIICTEATASRNYYPGLTEAYHRKLPVLAITCLHDYSYIGNLEPQVIDRSISPPDTLKLKVSLPVIKDEADFNESQLMVNKAFLELTRRGGGPVHINLPWSGGQFDFSVETLPAVRVINRYTYEDFLPEIKAKKIAVYIGSHGQWSDDASEALNKFCSKYNAVVFCDHSSKYYGKYRVQGALLASQKVQFETFKEIELLIHMGEETGDNKTVDKLRSVKEVWRVSPDGEVRDTFRKLTNVFEMSEQHFLAAYAPEKFESGDNYLKLCRREMEEAKTKIPELPFSNVYAASRIMPSLPSGSVIHFAASDTIRAWSYFELPESVRSGFNAGCRGIDGPVSTMIGASFAHPDKLYYCVVGDLAFFYDLNCLGNRCIRNNVRILLVNNDGGNIFRHRGHVSQTWLGFEDSNKYIAAGGHFGCKSKDLVKSYATALGFEYLSAENKDEFEETYKKFVLPSLTDRPMIFEIFTDSKIDASAFDIMNASVKDTKQQLKDAVKGIVGEQGVSYLKALIRKG